MASDNNIAQKTIPEMTGEPQAPQALHDHLQELGQNFQHNDQSFGSGINQQQYLKDLMVLEKMHSDSYSGAEKEREALYEAAAKKNGIDLNEGSQTPQANFEKLFETFLAKGNPIAESAPEAANLVDQDIAAVDEQQIIDFAALRIPEGEQEKLRESIRVAAAFEDTLGEGKEGFSQSLAANSDQINEEINKNKDRNSALASTAIFAGMTVATGGANLAISGTLYGASMAMNPKVQEVLGKVEDGITGFLEGKGINMDPYHKASSVVKDKFQGVANGLGSIKEKLFNKKTALGALAVGAGAVAAYSMGVSPESFLSAEAVGNAPTGPALGEVPTVDPQTTGPALGEVPTVDPQTSPEVSGIAENDPNAGGRYDGETTQPGAQSGPVAEGDPNPGDSSGIQGGEVPAPQAYEVTLGESGTIYQSAEAMLEQSLGTQPTDQQVMQLTNDIMVENNVSSMSDLQVGQVIQTPADLSSYADVTSVSQEAVDNVRSLEQGAMQPAEGPAPKETSFVPYESRPGPPGDSVMSNAQRPDAPVNVQPHNDFVPMEERAGRPSHNVMSNSGAESPAPQSEGSGATNSTVDKADRPGPQGADMMSNSGAEKVEAPPENSVDTEVSKPEPEFGNTATTDKPEATGPQETDLMSNSGAESNAEMPENNGDYGASKPEGGDTKDINNKPEVAGPQGTGFLSISGAEQGSGTPPTNPDKAQQYAQLAQQEKQLGRGGPGLGA